MEFIAPFEHWLIKINKPLPKLPEKMTSVAARLMWIFCVIGAAISIGSVYAALGMIQIIEQAGPRAVEIYGVTQDQAWLNGGLAMTCFAISAVLQILAVRPLKKRLIIGWRLLLLSSGIALAISIITSIYPFSLAAIIISMGLFAVVFYLLAQLHRHFHKPAKSTQRKEKKKHV